MHIRFRKWDFTIYNITISLYISKVIERIAKVPAKKYKKKTLYIEMQSLIDIWTLDTSQLNEKEVDYLAKMYFEHRYDLLGSGWKCVNVNGGGDTDIYSEIDWSKDYISGYIWALSAERDEIPHGADVKTVWELSRMQYLLQLSVFALKNEAFRERAIREYKNVINDFIDHNEFLQGINWTSAMDVAIRAINMLLAYDILRQLDEFGILEEDFNYKLVDSIYKHEQFILKNLECDLLHGRNNNHYFSNLLGLLIIEAYLNANKKIWTFAYKEILIEMKKQYSKEGSNYEGSTSYHRLSTEILVLAAAFMGRIEGKIPVEVLDILNKASYFTDAVTKSNGRVVQIGDNDSGRIIKLSPEGCFLPGDEVTEKYINLKEFQEKEYFDEDVLNHGALLAEIGGLLDNDVTVAGRSKYPLESSFVKAIVKLEQVDYKDVAHGGEVEYYNNKMQDNLEYEVLTEISIAEANDKLDIGAWKGYPDFGLYYYRTGMFQLFLKLKGKSKAVTGHIHDDILHLEFNVKGQDILVDPGTYVYTADRRQRDDFRSCRAHIVPLHKEARCVFKSTFQVMELANCEVLQIDKNVIGALMSKGQLKHYRAIKVEANKIIIVDKSNQPFVANFKNYPFFSSGYGKIEKYQESSIVKITNKSRGVS